MFEDAFEHFTEGVENPRLTEAEWDSCEGDITGMECLQALKSMANGKVPGPSGFTKEFFLTFWDCLGPLTDILTRRLGKGLFSSPSEGDLFHCSRKKAIKGISGISVQWCYWT